VSNSEVVKKIFIELLEKDVEFRYALMGLLGYKELLDRFSRLEEGQRKLWENQNKLWEEVRGSYGRKLGVLGRVRINFGRMLISCGRR